MQHLFRVIGMH